MALPDLHLFEKDLRNTPARGSNAPPRTIRAKDLDQNFTKITLVDSRDDPPTYRVEYTKTGTVIRDLKTLPDGERKGDLIYWDGQAWKVLPSVTSASLRVLGIQNGALQWIATQDC